MTANRVDRARARGRRIRGLDAAERADQRRDLLLDAALELFARDEYANTAIEALCQHAYVGNKAFYEHFSTKEACYLELLQRNTGTIMATVTAAFGEASDDEAEGTAAILSAFAHALVDDPRVAAVTFGQASGISPTIERQRRANRRQAAALVLEIWRKYGGTPPGDGAESLAVAVVGGLFDQISDTLDRTDCAPSADDVAELITAMTEFALTVRAGMRERAE
ncbi:putative TetR family transcriptional regulator [Gordonia araii NBRC 100433]|uniref:Putative TetR family transcriptional regulator n=1 Tax=Gordonia araii NBRC 100433 TaxID=1073574 RepID=G7GY66_9ACTN|nr:TetR/AcrR family transcriptional regulator [Gordonia araii]NNG98149.1 TetR/AcrR family transcriptional regulator [Gordonia araii NBRC 100433]GAB08541.1 putative TetR family transcriptional regulator [Gordonia araii NBRC 100433]